MYLLSSFFVFWRNESTNNKSQLTRRWKKKRRRDGRDQRRIHWLFPKVLNSSLVSDCLYVGVGVILCALCTDFTFQSHLKAFSQYSEFCGASWISCRFAFLVMSSKFWQIWFHKLPSGVMDRSFSHFYSLTGIRLWNYRSHLWEVVFVSWY